MSEQFDINALGLNPEEFKDVDFDKMPTTIGSIIRPPQPGVYRFKLPTARAIFTAIKTMATTDWGQRIQVTFKDEAALTNLSLKNEPYNANLNNTPRYIGKADNKQAVSDLLMLLKALGVTPEANNNAAHIKALLSAEGRSFKAEHTLSTTCNKNRDIYKDNKVQAGIKGCGQAYRVEGYTQRDGTEVWDIPKDENGLVALRFGCATPECGAELTSWGRLQGFRSAE
jgi:hypothetical protein